MKRRRNSSSDALRDSLDGDDRTAPEGPSKTQRKQAMHELQALGEALLALPEERLAAVAMEDDLRQALDEHRRIRGFEARRRQLQYIGKLLRAADAAPLRRAVEELSAGSAREVASQHEAERWRERLIDEEQALTEWLRLYPDTEVQTLHSLIRNARREATGLRPTDADGAPTRKGRHYRLLYQQVYRQLTQQLVLSLGAAASAESL